MVETRNLMSIKSNMSSPIIYTNKTYHVKGEASNSCFDLDINSARCDKGTQTSCNKINMYKNTCIQQGVTKVQSHPENKYLCRNEKIIYHLLLELPIIVSPSWGLTERNNQI